MALRLICAIPDPGCPGIPHGVFFQNTPEGEKLAAEFAQALVPAQRALHPAAHSSPARPVPQRAALALFSGSTPRDRQQQGSAPPHAR